MIFEAALIFWASLHGVLGVNAFADSQVARVRSGEVPPIIVPIEQGIPWLTEKTIKARKEWDLTHSKIQEAH